MSAINHQSLVAAGVSAFPAQPKKRIPHHWGRKRTWPAPSPHLTKKSKKSEHARPNMPVLISSLLATLFLLFPAKAAELVVNGDFSQGNTGFGTDYVTNTDPVYLSEGAYAIVSDPHSVHPYFPSIGDHTTGNGLMMVVNGSEDAPSTVWRQIVAVDQCSDYQFSLWLASCSGGWYPSTLSVLINGVVVLTNCCAFDSEWHQFSAPWNSQSNSTAQIDIVDTCGVSSGNDFALDDISLSGPAPITGTVAVLVQNAQSLDPDEENIVDFMAANGISDVIADASMITNGAVDLQTFKVLYMRTATEPTSYNNTAVLDAIRSTVQNGARLIVEFYGVYLPSYLGAGTVTPSTWDPDVCDHVYFVEPIDSSCLFANMPQWSPPALPDDHNQLICGLLQNGGRAYPSFSFTDPHTVGCWILVTTYGWPYQSTNSAYDAEYPGMFTGERSVHSSDWNTFSYTPIGNGQIIALENPYSYSSAATMEIGPAADRIRANAISQDLASIHTATLTITPSTRTAYGSLLVGNTADRTFTVSNVGTFTIWGSVSVSAPFSVVSGGSYTLVPGASQTVTVRYAPLAAENDAAYVTFTDGSSTQTRQVTGSAYTDPTASTGTITGQVTRSDTDEALNGIGITAAGPSGDIFGGSIPGTISVVIGGQAGRYSITGLPPNAHYQILATPGGQPFNITKLNDVAVLAGQSTTVDITMTPVSSQNQLPTPVVLVRGAQLTGAMEFPDESWWILRAKLWDAGFAPQNIWDCNEDSTDQGSLVIDGTQGNAPNAARLNSYIQGKVLQYAQQNSGQYPPVINIVAHSMGGLIVRQALGNNDSFFLTDAVGPPIPPIKVGKVIMLGTPNGGSPLADDFYWASCDATRDMTTAKINGNNGANDGFNFSHPWPSGVSLYLYAATDSLYSGNPWLTAGGLWLGGPTVGPFASPWYVNDGAVPMPSVSGTDYYQSWSPPSFMTPICNFRASPVEDCTDHQITGRGIDHFSLVTDPLTLDWVIATLNGTGTSPAAKSAKPLPAIQTPMDATSTNLLPMQQIEQISSMLSSGQVNTASVISDAATTLSFQLLAHATDVVFRVEEPSGIMINSTTPASNTNVQYSVMNGSSNLMLITYTISNPATGNWQAVLDGSSMSETQASCLMRVFGDSTVSLLPQTIPPCNQGQDVVVSCALADLSTNPGMPVLNASITAAIQFADGSTNGLTLYDDGWHNDGAPNDGLYAAVLTNVQEVGTYSIAYRATGTNSHGQALQRVATGGFSVSSGDASLWGDPVYQNLDTNGDGIADFLEVQCWVNPTVAGNYILAGDLVDASGTNRFSQSAAFAADGSGPTMATLIFNLAEMRAAGGQGTYDIENLQLFEVTTNGTAWLDAYHGSSVVNIQAAKAINVSPQNLAANVSRNVTLEWADGGGSSNYDVYFGTNPVSLSFKTNQTGTTYFPGILAYNTAYCWQINARNAAGVTTGDVWTFTTLPADMQNAGFGGANCFGFTVTGSSNLVIVVEACTNLDNPIWSPVATNTLTGGSCCFSDPQWTNYPVRFYRFRLP
jgi:hypothetical protein